MKDNNELVVIDIEDIRLAKKLVKDVPEIKKIVDNFIRLMHPYSNYIDVAKAINQADESIIMLETLEIVYRQYLLPRRGKQ